MAGKNELITPIRITLRHHDRVVFEKLYSTLPVVIGRSLICDIPLPQYQGISREHAELRLEKGQLCLVDLSSANGILFQGQPWEKVFIKGHTTLNLGELSLDLDTNDEVDEGICFDDQTLLIDSQPTESPYPVLDEVQLRDIPSVMDFSNSRIEMLKKITEESRRQNEMHGRVNDLDLNTLSFSEMNLQESPPLDVNDIDLEVTHSSPTEASPSSSGLEAVCQGKKARGFEPVLGEGFVSGMETVGIDRAVESVQDYTPSRLRAEAVVTWRGQIWDSRVYEQGERVRIGKDRDNLYVPLLKKNYDLAQFNGKSIYCLLPSKVHGTLRTTYQGDVSLEDLIRCQALPRKNGFYALKLSNSDVVSIDVNKDVKVHLRYVPAPRQLSKAKFRTPDEMVKKSAFGSTGLHLLILLLAFMIFPSEKVPQVKNMQRRVAKLLIPKAKPKPKIKKKVVKKKEPKSKKKLAKKLSRPKKKKIVKRVKRRPKKVIVKVSKKMKRLNKLPFKVKANTANRKPVRQKPVAKKIDQLGALAALGAISPSTRAPSSQPVAININPKAGGQTSKLSPKSVIGAIKSKSGRLAMGGLAGVKTKGRGFGSGKGYGVQGVKGRAGRRGVAGAVIGSPRLMQVDRTEGLSQKQVMTVVKKYVGKIQSCYERALLSAPGISGRVEYEWYILPSGKVRWAKVKKSAASQADVLNNCVVQVFRKMRFPKAKNGETTQASIGFPFGRN